MKERRERRANQSIPAKGFDMSELPCGKTGRPTETECS